MSRGICLLSHIV
uniref:Uncharacterized protein n=1 Tax=Moniliophthora roreri TaxID=221103 RepID=A0A0W0GDI6_MONRR